MKKAFVLLVILSVLPVTASSQNRICEWDAEKITSVRVEVRNNDQNTDVMTFSERRDIETILSFLRNVEFRTGDGSDFKRVNIREQWIVKMIFKGQQDQVFMMTGYATIGKTLFSIDDDVVEKVRKVIYELK